jgi:3-hydroxy-9,10-secoandrosta-1,3,5(10)-triene-9,17-dione monooxygenase reductase component
VTLDGDVFREALSFWPSGVTIVACRSGARVVATTVSAFTSLSLEPPRVLIALGPNATVLPFLSPGASFGISVLAREQARLATVYADSFPVGPDPFTGAGTPLVRDALVGLDCRVTESRGGGDHTVIIAEVLDAAIREQAPLIRFRRRYHGLQP